MKIKQIRENTTEEILAQIKETERKMLRMKTRRTVTDGIQIRAMRRNVARMHTVIREREMNSND
ncbi:MAG: 50S ribosomal protein L29 [Kiritimatiellia bacterium]|jgi:ribosomal protein L29